jgi:hypothetical protein
MNRESQDESLLLNETKSETHSKMLELGALGAWQASISSFILVNNFVGPWPEAMTQVPERVFFLYHMLGGMLFGGGVLLTAAIEWLVVENKNDAVLQFWFDKVPLLDGIIVLPALTVSIVSGTGLSIRRYGSLGHAPEHIQAALYALMALCAWWALTDLTTQGKALIAVNDVPNVVELRTISNVVSSLFVIVLYAMMVMKSDILLTFP